MTSKFIRSYQSGDGTTYEVRECNGYYKVRWQTGIHSRAKRFGTLAAADQWAREAAGIRFDYGQSTHAYNK